MVRLLTACPPRAGRRSGDTVADARLGSFWLVHGTSGRKSGEVRGPTHLGREPSSGCPPVAPWRPTADRRTPRTRCHRPPRRGTACTGRRRRSPAGSGDAAEEVHEVLPHGSPGGQRAVGDLFLEIGTTWVCRHSVSCLPIGNALASWLRIAGSSWNVARSDVTSGPRRAGASAAASCCAVDATRSSSGGASLSDGSSVTASELTGGSAPFTARSAAGAIWNVWSTPETDCASDPSDAVAR